MNDLTNFIEKSKGLTRNPLGIIALFISMIYGIACLVLSTCIDNLQGPSERLPLIWFIIGFPVIILAVFIYLVVYHHTKLYAPSDYKDERNFMIGKPISNDLNSIRTQIESLKEITHIEDLPDSVTKISEQIEKIKEKSEIIPINSLWRLNHWGGACASLAGDTMIFSGLSAPQGVDGSHVDLNNILEIGNTYEISCFVKSVLNTNGMFKLWCHDNTGITPNGSDESTDFKTPSVDGEFIKLYFKAKYNNNIRIHLQYKPGQGQIEVRDIRISEKR